MNHRIAVVQMTSAMEVETNLAAATQLVHRAADQNVEAIFLPENFAALANENPRQIGTNEETQSGLVRRYLSDLSRSVVVGFLPEPCLQSRGQMEVWWRYQE
jgi:predicted amidohydrolase